MRTSLAVLLTAAALSAPASAQTAYRPDSLTADDYARAEGRMAPALRGLVYGASVRPVWLEDGRFWYRNDVRGGAEFVLVDPSRRTRARAFDHEDLAAALSAALDTTFNALSLPFRSFEYGDRESTVIAEVASERYACDLDAGRCDPVPQGSPSPSRDEVLSPDGRRAAFVRDHDLWVRELETGREVRLTTDGSEDFGYATNNAGWTRSDRPVLLWSPDSRRIATFRHDARGVGMMYLTSTEVGHPELEAWRYPLPEDSVIFRISRVIADVEAPESQRLVRLDMPPDPHRSTICDHVYCGGTFADNQWSPDGTRLAFVSSSRDHKRATLRVADARTGVVRDVLEETEETFYESGYSTPNWRFLPGSDEVIWFSQRDDWGHLYLYDLDTGELKNRITRGDWNVREIVHLDPEARRLWFVGNGREDGDPYFRYLYRVDFDGSDLTRLTPDSADHTISLSPDGEHFVDSWSTPTTPPVTALRSLDDGRVVVPLEEADLSELRAAGWTPPIPFSVKARDGVTDLHGLLFRPADFDPSLKYPVVNYVYPGPQSGSVGSRSFSATHRDHEALAELGFVVVALDATGTPGRSKSFHEAWYGNMGDNGLPDQMGGIGQLAARHVWIDLDRVGIWGHSGGGYAAADAIFRYPDFYKVAVSQAGNHDNRNYEDDWGEKWQGLLVEYPDGTTNYDNQANQLQAEKLEGKLLLAHGTTDSNVPPSNTMLVVNALIAANRDFDLILFPNRGHGFAFEPYMIRRRWDYFVRHLLGAEPPKEYEFGGMR